MTQTSGRKRGVGFWVGMLLLAAVVLFVGSAVLSGISESRHQAKERELTMQLSSSGLLMSHIKDAADSKKWRADLLCYTLAGASYKLAEARALGISKAAAVDATNDPEFMRPLLEMGSNPRLVLMGLADHVYDSKAEPKMAFEARLSACGTRRG